MNHRQRILATLRGEWVDQLPWAPRIDLWYDAHNNMGTLPGQYAGWSMYDILRDLGVALYNNLIKVYSTRPDDTIEHVVQTRGYETRHEYRTPLGTASMLFKSTPDLARMGVRALEVEYLLKSVDDYPIVEYIIEHTTLVPEHEQVDALMKEFGNDGVVLASMGYSAPLKLMREYIGYDNCFFHVVDHPQLFERLLAAVEEQGRRIQQIAADSPASVIVVDANATDAIPGPRLYRKYLLPYLKSCVDYLHGKGKLTVAHMDGDTQALLEPFLETGIDIAEAITPAPMSNFTLAEARQAWVDRVVIWGGVPTTVLCPDASTDREFEDFMRQLFEDIRPGNRFVLGLGDNLPTDGSLDRVRRISALVEQYGKLPMPRT